MKKLIHIDRAIPWLPQPGEGRLYVTDQLPPLALCRTAFGFAFNQQQILLTQLKRRGWDIPGGHIDPGETPQQATIREVWEETYAQVEIIDLVGIQELEIFSPHPEQGWDLPLSIQVFFRVRILALAPFEGHFESSARKFFSPAEARCVLTMANHAGLYEEALRRSLAPA
jgi:8-oxo-dGTP diphosphatase